MDADHKLMKDMARAPSYKRQINLFGEPCLAKHQTVLLSVTLPRSGPIVEMLELHAQHRGLQSIEPAIDAKKLVKVPALFAMNSQHLQAPEMLQVTGHNHAAVAGAAQVL